MNRNQILRTYLDDPVAEEALKKKRLKKEAVTLFTSVDDKLIEVIQTAVNNLDDQPDPDKIARRINKVFTNLG
jgi:hypothetical protein